MRGTITDESGGALPELSVTLFGVDDLVRKSLRVGRDGSFHFDDLTEGEFTLVLVRPGLGEIRRSVRVSAELADAHGVVETTIIYSSAEAAANPSAGTVSLAGLQIPGKAQELYRDAQQRLTEGDPERAQRLLLEATRLAPAYAAAWNTLGVLFFQSGDVNQAEYFYRKALEAEPGYIHSVMNLGAVLLRSGRYQDALRYNEFAVDTLPLDATANVQLGMNYYQLGRVDAAEPLLVRAIEIDPSHVAHPRLLLAEIRAARGEYQDAAVLLERELAAGLEADLASRVRGSLERIRAAMAESTVLGAVESALASEEIDE